MSKKIIITGCSSGFGKLAAMKLAKDGHTVIATMRNASSQNKSVADELNEYARKHKVAIHVIELDVTDEKSVNQAVTVSNNITNGFDVLINNAGYGIFGLTETFTIEESKKMFEVNVFGVLRMIRAILPHMRKQQSGLIINLSSGAGGLVFPFGGIYSATKFALEAISEALRMELKPLGIDSVCIEPGSYPTTDFGANMKMGDDDARIDSYGEYGQAPLKMMKGFGESMKGQEPDPMEIIEIMKELIGQELGSRKARTPKANVAEMLHGINAEKDKAQEQLATMLGF
ncbi:MAG: SDR family oxidoreductase [Cytophagales bacterium]|jgi:NAD(P)-dependent dehydrogenase (short-subunit alcohol dehydrogenase family)|nr:SDR family oxidoreductase [Cytophagales bacterium]MCA6366619.1 SDR family oxidoreductase [Cytophagales bacterium]MCA6370030.1 SDR family oxidoreductase [Cytophagales bacterium]MCA6375211.1 SDR family oxidoreductase [Cytophagales bacterium]MCA6384266.1 SDR family oxidoreductase [Cytophagales bacterium]